MLDSSEFPNVMTRVIGVKPETMGTEKIVPVSVKNAEFRAGVFTSKSANAAKKITYRERNSSTESKQTNSAKFDLSVNPENAFFAVMVEEFKILAVPFSELFVDGETTFTIKTADLAKIQRAEELATLEKFANDLAEYFGTDDDEEKLGLFVDAFRILDAEAVPNWLNVPNADNLEIIVTVDAIKEKFHYVTKIMVPVEKVDVHTLDEATALELEELIN